MILPILLMAFSVDQSPAVRADWWTIYGDPELTRLVEKARAGNLDLQTASARIAQSRALAGVSKAKLGPDIEATGSAQRLRGGFAEGVARIPTVPGAAPSGSFVSPFETPVFNLGTDMKWELDLFGGNRAGLRAARKDTAAEMAIRDDLALSISAEVARVYIELRGIEERLAITSRNIDAQRDLLSLTKQRAEAGLDTLLDVDRQELLLHNTEANVPPLEADRQVHLDRLAVLVGDESEARRALPAASQLNEPPLKEGVPSELLKRRPDVRAAEARFQASLERVQQTHTDLYPKIILNGLMGRQSTSISAFGLGAGNFFNLQPQLQLPLFNSGRIRSSVEAQKQAAEQARLTYGQDLLKAFEEAENAIANYRRQRERRDKLDEAVASANQSLDLTQDRHRAGLEDFLSVLDAQRGLYDAEFQRSSAHTQALTESVALYKAVGGGWNQ
jgi:NodT family efflux transporter outer membrane factor (OMF) lipoprotein